MMQEVKLNNETIKIETIDNESSWWKWVTRLGGLLGIMLTALALFQIFFTKPSVSAKMISFARDGKKLLVFPAYLSDDTLRLKAIKYVMKISITVSDAHLNYQDILVDLEYEGGLKLRGRHFYPNRHFNEWNFSGGVYRLNVPQENLLLYRTTLEKDKTHIGYLSFIAVDSLDVIQNSRPQSIQLTFVSSQNKLLSGKPEHFVVDHFMWQRNKQMETVYEPEIWKLAGSNEYLIDREFEKAKIDEVISRFVPIEERRRFKNYIKGLILHVHPKLE